MNIDLPPALDHPVQPLTNWLLAGKYILYLLVYKLNFHDLKIIYQNKLLSS